MPMTSLDPAVLVFWIAIAVIVIGTGYFRAKERVARFKMIQTLAEKGQPLSEVFGEERRSHGTRGLVHSGILLICMGLAIGLLFWSMHGGNGLFHSTAGRDAPDWLMMVGVFPFLLGVARLVSALYESKTS